MGWIYYVSKFLFLPFVYLSHVIFFLDLNKNSYYEKTLIKNFIYTFFILSLMKVPSPPYALGAAVGAFTPYWIIILIISIIKSNNNKTKFKWTSNNYWLIIPLIIFLIGLFGKY
jgi:hypothetical protein